MPIDPVFTSFIMQISCKLPFKVNVILIIRLKLCRYYCDMYITIVYALKHASCVVVVELLFNFVFILSFGGFDGSPEIVTGLFSIVSVSGFKGRCPR